MPRRYRLVRSVKDPMPATKKEYRMRTKLRNAVRLFGKNENRPAAEWVARVAEDARQFRNSRLKLVPPGEVWPPEAA